MCLCCGPLIKAIDNYIAKANDDLIDLLESEGFVHPEDTVAFADAIEDLLTTALEDETAYFLAHIEESLDIEHFASEIWPDVKLNDDLKVKIAEIFKEQLQTFMPEYAQYYLDQSDPELSIRVITERTKAWIESWSEELGSLMQLTSHTELEAILQEGLENGDGIADFTRRIMDSGIRGERYRARRAALTEVLRAHSVAQQESMMQSPVVEEKMWRHTGSYRNDPRKNHVAMDGQRVPKGQPFILKGAKGGTYECMYPRDPILPASESVNCHCISQAIVNEDILGLSLNERRQLQREAIEQMDDDWEKELDAKNKAKAGIE